MEVIDCMWNWGHFHSPSDHQLKMWDCHTEQLPTKATLLHVRNTTIIYIKGNDHLDKNLVSKWQRYRESGSWYFDLFLFFIDLNFQTWIVFTMDWTGNVPNSTIPDQLLFTQDHSGTSPEWIQTDPKLDLLVLQVQFLISLKLIWTSSKTVPCKHKLISCKVGFGTFQFRTFQSSPVQSNSWTISA